MKVWWEKFASAVKVSVVPTGILCWAVTSIVVAIAGPFGTFETKPFLWRLSYWGALIAVAIPISMVCRGVWKAILGRRGKWLEDLFTFGSLALVFGPALVFFNPWLVGPEISSAMTWELTTLATFLVGMGVVTMRRAVWHSASVGEDQARDRLLDRIDAPQGVRLSRVSSDNHHIRILTDDGKEYRILMRLRDAVTEITVEKGFCVHRSHWVAEAMIDGVNSENGKEVLVMTTGASIPVGPKYRANLVETGLLAV